MEKIQLSEIKLKSEYLRFDTDIEKLKKSIETVGLIHPLVLNGNNELIAGGRRYSACKELGIEEVPVIRVHKTSLEQELISIDENLIRLDLNKIEFEKCLSRGLEIYEELNPMAKKFEEEDLTVKEENEIQVDKPNKERSFVDLTAEKTGLSKKVIQSAIKRDKKSSERIKEMRKTGELNATQTNELVKLEKEEQDQIIDYARGKSAKEIKDMVKWVREKGVEKAIEEVESQPLVTKEYKSFRTLMKRLNKISAQILLEELPYEGEDSEKFMKEINTLQNNLQQMISLKSTNFSQQNEEVETTKSDEEDYPTLDSENLDLSVDNMINQLENDNSDQYV